MTMIATCSHCHPCEVTKHEDPLTEEALLLPDDVSPSLARKHLYHVYTKNILGVLGKNNDHKIPECIICFIRALFPDPDGKHMGYKEK